MDLDGVKDGRVKQRAAFIREAYAESDQTLRLARRLVGKDPTTFVGSDHGFAPQFLAIDASKPLVDMGLLSRPQTSNCRTGDGRDDRQGQGVLGRRDAAGLPQPRRARPGRRRPASRCAAAEEAATVAAIKATYLGLTDPNDWTHDGNPEGWNVIDRAFTKAEARHIPNGPGSTADMAHPTRTGDLVVFSYPPYQFDAETPGTLVAPSHFFGQHGYVPDVQDLAANVNMRATFLAGGAGIGRGTVSARSIDLAPTLAFLLGIPEPQHSQGTGPARRRRRRRRRTHPCRSSGSTTSTASSTRPRGAYDNGINARVGGASFLATMFDEDLDALPGQGLILAGGDNVGASPRTRRSSRTCRRSTWRTPGASTPRPTATTSSTTASPACSSTRHGPTSRSWPPTSSTRPPARRRRGSRRRWCSGSTA